MAEEADGRTTLDLRSPGDDRVADAPDAGGADQGAAAGLEVGGDRRLIARLAGNAAEFQRELRQTCPPIKGGLWGGVYRRSHGVP